MTPPEKRLSPLFTWRSAIVESELPATQRHVALTLSLHMNERGGSCFPTHDQLRDETGLGRSTVIKALKELEAAGWLVRHPGGGRRRGGNGQATEYEATVPLVDCSPDRTVPDGDENRPAEGENRPADGHQDVIQDDIEGRHNLSGAADAAPEVRPEPPPVVMVEGRNLALDALAAVTGIKEGSPRMIQAVVALNGRKGQPDQGIRWLYWGELRRWAEEHDRHDRLLEMVEHPEEFAEYLAKAIKRRGDLFKEKMPGVIFGPGALRDWFLDLDGLAEDGSSTGDAFDWGDA